MRERNPLGCSLEAAALARLPLCEASRGQIFQVQGGSLKKQIQQSPCRKKIWDTSYESSSAAASRAIKKRNKTGNSRDSVSHHKSSQCDTSEREKGASLDCKTQLQSSILAASQRIKKNILYSEREKKLLHLLAFAMGPKDSCPFYDLCS